MTAPSGPGRHPGYDEQPAKVDNPDPLDVEVVWEEIETAHSRAGLPGPKAWRTVRRVRSQS